MAAAMARARAAVKAVARVEGRTAAKTARKTVEKGVPPMDARLAPRVTAAGAEVAVADARVVVASRALRIRAIR